jgi:hypothetical protein
VGSQADLRVHELSKCIARVRLRLRLRRRGIVSAVWTSDRARASLEDRSVGWAGPRSPSATAIATPPRASTGGRHRQPLRGGECALAQVKPAKRRGRIEIVAGPVVPALPKKTAARSYGGVSLPDSAHASGRHATWAIAVSVPSEYPGVGNDEMRAVLIAGRTPGARGGLVHRRPPPTARVSFVQLGSSLEVTAGGIGSGSTSAAARRAHPRPRSWQTCGTVGCTRGLLIDGPGRRRTVFTLIKTSRTSRSAATRAARSPSHGRRAAEQQKCPADQRISPASLVQWLLRATWVTRGCGS